MSEIICYKGKEETKLSLEALQNEMAQYLQMDNLSFLIGAGCSSNIVNGEETGIPGMAALYNSFFDENQGFEIAGQDKVAPMSRTKNYRRRVKVKNQEMRRFSYIMRGVAFPGKDV